MDIQVVAFIVSADMQRLASTCNIWLQKCLFWCYKRESYGQIRVVSDSHMPSDKH